jgi:hypothetical protein
MKRLNISEKEIDKLYPGLPKKGDKFHVHKNDPKGKHMNKIIDRYVVVHFFGRKAVRIDFEKPDDAGHMYTEFDVYD